MSIGMCCISSSQEDMVHPNSTHEMINVWTIKYTNKCNKSVDYI